MFSGAGDAFSRRRWASSPVLLILLIFCFMVRCFVCLLPLRLLWSFEGRRSRRTTKRRKELRLFVVLLPLVLPLRFVLSPATSREDSLTAALIWSSVSDPIVPPSGCRRTSHSVDLFQIRQPFMEHRGQPTSSISPDSESIESHKPPCFAPLLSFGPRSQNVTSSDPSLLDNTSISSSLKVTLSYPTWCGSYGGMILLRRSFSGDYSFGVDERSVYRPLLTKGNVLMFSHDWAWPICVLYIVSPRNCFPRPYFLEEKTIQFLLVFGDWASFSEIFGLTGISPGFSLSYLSFGMYLPVDSSGRVLFRSSSSSEDKPLPPYPLPFVRGVSSDLFLSVCSSSYIVLLSCGAVSTGPEDTSEITSVVFVDGVLTSTSHYVTILQLSDFVVKALPTHSSTVLNSLSSSFEDLSCLTYLSIVVYVYCQRGWIILSCYCIEED